jgi:hypothetical protein
MLGDIWAWCVNVVCWLRGHDIPNWLAMPLWPLIVILWHRRSVNSVRGLEVHFFDAGPEALEFGGKKHRAITIQFTNHTGCVAYISGARVRSITKKFFVPVEAARDVGRDSYHLKFSASPAEVAMRGVAANSGVAVPLATREVTLQTNDSRQTAMPGDPPPELFKHSPSWMRRIFRRPKYYVIEYTAMISTRRYAVATVF